MRHRVGSVSDVPVDSMVRVEVAGRSICVAHTREAGFAALDDRCTHEDESLSDGELWGLDVECPAHGSRFNFKTGEVTGLPASTPARVCPVFVENGEIFIED